MLTVPQAAQRTGRNPETIRRWIRAGKLRAHKVGTQHVIDEQDLLMAAPATEAVTSSAIGRRPRWVERDEFLQHVLVHQADAALAAELRALAPDTTDDLSPR
jgi:excisionase family DNA binding protein